MRILSGAKRKITVALVGAAVAATTLGAATAQAAVRPGVVILSHPIFKLYRYYDAPTPDLFTVANALQFDLKSVSSHITLPPGLKLSHPVDISISYPVPNQTQPYLFGQGNSWNYQFPTNTGLNYTGQLTVTLVDHVTSTQTQSYQVNWQPTVKPLFDITISPLKFYLKDNCDWFGDSEIKLQWRDPSGVDGAFSYPASTDSPFVQAGGFARTYHAVEQSSNLLAPGVQWWEDDFDNFAPPPPVNGANLATHLGYHFSQVTHAADGQSCRGELDYSVSRTLLTY